MYKESIFKNVHAEISLYQGKKLILAEDTCGPFNICKIYDTPISTIIMICLISIFLFSNTFK